MKKVTINNLAECTEQEVFNFVGKHLIKQNAKSSSKRGLPYYHAPNGAMCACGVLIPKEQYDKKMERLRWRIIVKRMGLTQIHKDLLEALQRVHDYADVEKWEFSLASVAKDYKLKMFKVKK